jgi:hypothetical protein
MRQNKTVFSMDKSRLCFERKPFSLSTKAVFARDFLRFSFGHGAKVKIILSVVASFVAHWGLLGTFGYNRVHLDFFVSFCSQNAAIYSILKGSPSSSTILFTSMGV